jgi:DNA polymerase type B, organellar and viral
MPLTDEQLERERLRLRKVKADGQVKRRALRKAEGNPEPSGSRSANRGIKRRARDHFIALDSEGAEIEGRHRTILWTAAWQSFQDPDEFHYSELEGERSPTEVLEWLESVKRQAPHRTMILYGASYDFNMIQKSLLGDRFDKARYLHKKGAALMDLTDSKGAKSVWRLDNLGKRKMSFARAKNAEQCWVINPKSGLKQFVHSISFSLYDVFGFFQRSFIGAIEESLGKDYPDLPEIREGKKNRGSFTADQLPIIKSYTRCEMRGLLRMMGKFRDALYSVDIKPKSWLGAGAAAGALLKREGVDAHVGDRSYPDEVRDVFERGFFGGRIEMFQYGAHLTTLTAVKGAPEEGPYFHPLPAPKTGPIYDYDINSAYPSAMLELPSFAEEVEGEASHWQYFDGAAALDRAPRFSVFHVRWAMDPRARIFPFPWRAKNGSVCFPEMGEGWYWRPEVEAALAHAPEGVEILGAWGWTGDDVTRPFSWITGLYEERKRIVNEARAKGEKPPLQSQALKLALNSCYGKTAQTVGGDGKHAFPPYHHFAWAGWITSRTRARLYDAAMYSPEDVVMIATDGLFTRKPNPNLKVSETKELGCWELSTITDMLCVQSGVYLKYSPKDKKWAFVCRGISRPGAGSEEAQKWAAGKPASQILEYWRTGRTSIDFELRSFLTLGTCQTSQGRFAKWTNWEHSTKAIQITPQEGTKRVIDRACKKKAYLNLLKTWARNPFSTIAPNEIDRMSAPTSPKWKNLEEDLDEIFDLFGNAQGCLDE